MCREIMEAMWIPKNYIYAYVLAVLYTYFLTIPGPTSMYWAYGDTLLHHSNAFGVLPPSKARNVSIIAMILHQVYLWSKLYCITYIEKMRGNMSQIFNMIIIIKLHFADFCS